MQFVDALQGVVEGDDAAITCIAAHVLIDIVGGEPLRVVACDEVPHHDSELL